MAIEIVEIVNPNGRKGLVAATSAAAAHYDRPPSSQQAETEGDGMPAGNASAEAWRTYAVDVRGMSPDDANAKGRDELVALYKSQED